MSKLVSSYKFAQMKGVHKKTVEEAMADGRISFTIVNGKKRIDPEKAMIEWEQNTDKSMVRTKVQSQPVESRGPSYAQSRAIKEAYAAKLTKLDFEEKSGKLVEVEKVNQHFFKIGRRVRDALLSMPDRLSQELAVETDSHVIHQNMLAEINQVLDELSNGGFKS